MANEQYTFTKREHLKMAGMPLLSLTMQSAEQSQAFHDLNQCFSQMTEHCKPDDYSNSINFFQHIVENNLIQSNISDACLAVTPFSRIQWNVQDGLHATGIFTLHSSHFLPHVPEGHKCGRSHGHNFHIICNWFKSQYTCNNASQIFTPIYEKLNKTLLNKIEGLENPTSEHLSSWIFETMKPQWSQLRKVFVYETDNAGSAYMGGGEIWESFKKFSFDSCFVGSKNECMGHTFKVRLHVKDQLQEPFGWTIDFGDIKKLFKPYLEQLDHHCLSHLEELTSPNLQSISQWIMNRLKPELPSLFQIYLESTPYYSVKLTTSE